MLTFDFTIYNGTRKFFNLYDVYIRYSGNSKEDLFYKLCINNSSYRRARDTEQKVGREIISQLSRYFAFKIPSNKLILDLQKLANRIYKNMYYKIYESYETDIEYIEKLLKEKSIMFPILNLLKLFLIANSQKSTSKNLEDEKKLFDEVKLYKKFFTVELLELLDILTLFFETEFTDGEWEKNYTNAMAYQILSSRCFIKKKYIEALFYAYKSKKILLDDDNFKRVITINNTIMSSLLYVGNYEECLNVVSKQMLCIKSFGLLSETKNVNNFLNVALLGMKKYHNIIENLYDSVDINLTQLTCLIVAFNEVDKDMLKEYIAEKIMIESIDEFDKEYINSLLYYLGHKDKKLLKKFENFDITKSIIKILMKL